MIVATHKCFEKFYKKDTLGLPMTPGRWVSDFEYEPITILTVACVCGLGGHKWQEYVTRMEFDKIQKVTKFLRIRTIDGDEKLLNPANIVMVQNATLMTGIYASKNPKFKEGNHKYMLLVEDGHKVKQVSGFSSLTDY